MTTQTEPTYSIFEITIMRLTFISTNDIDGLNMLKQILLEEITLHHSLQAEWELIRINTSILRMELKL